MILKNLTFIRNTEKNKKRNNFNWQLFRIF